jgi:adenylate kinase
MGPPGAGKGTQARVIAAHYAIPAISTGSIFRANVEEGTDLGEAARGYLGAGEYVPDHVTNAMVRDRLDRPDCDGGFLLDGYPRTLAQVGALDEILAAAGRRLEAVVALEVDEEDLLERLIRRAEVEQRPDDTEEVIRRRQKLYAEETAPLLAEYATRGILLPVDGNGDVDEVAERIFAAVGVRPSPSA